jgi:hypothetical protein
MAKLTSRFHANILAMRLREKTRDREDPLTGKAGFTLGGLLRPPRRRAAGSRGKD